MKNNKINKKEMVFSISAVAKMFSVHQQTIRLYEKQGLIHPKRSSGNTRLFSEEDVYQLEEIIYLTHQLGINLAGVEMILKLKKQIGKMQKDINKIFSQTQEQLEHESQKSKHDAQESFKRLLQLKSEQESSIYAKPTTHKKEESIPLSLQSLLELDNNTEDEDNNNKKI